MPLRLRNKKNLPANSLLFWHILVQISFDPLFNNHILKAVFFKFNFEAHLVQFSASLAVNDIETNLSKRLVRFPTLYLKMNFARFWLIADIGRYPWGRKTKTLGNYTEAWQLRPRSSFESVNCLNYINFMICLTNTK